MGVFMREPLLDWQREARVVNAKRSMPGSAKDPVSAAEAADPADMHVNLKVILSAGSVCCIQSCHNLQCSLHTQCIFTRTALPNILARSW